MPRRLPTIKKKIAYDNLTLNKVSKIHDSEVVEYFDQEFDLLMTGIYDNRIRKIMKKIKEAKEKTS